MTWFTELFGFEESAEAVAANIEVEGETLASAANDRTFTHGLLTTPTLAEIRNGADAVAHSLPGELQVREVVASAGDLHADPANEGALFQVASQFNLLEMVSPSVTPADGITRYSDDRTQGPACAMACAAGTLHRNWFAQTTGSQIDCLADVGRELGNDAHRFWSMRNGYALLTGTAIDPSLLEAAGDELRIGFHRNTEVTNTATAPGHLVSQVYCSALPVAYSNVEPDAVAPLAELVLQASYEATLAAAVVNAAATGNRTVFLTLVGGGVFGNPIPWIVDAIAAATDRWHHTALDVAIVSFGRSNPELGPVLTPPR